MPRESRQAWRRRNAETERGIDAAVAEVTRERTTSFKESKERAAQRRAELAAKPAVDASTVEPGMWVLNRRGWAAEVVKINRTTATVTHMGSEMRWPLESIIAAKARA